MRRKLADATAAAAAARECLAAAEAAQAAAEEGHAAAEAEASATQVELAGSVAQEGSSPPANQDGLAVAVASVVAAVGPGGSADLQASLAALQQLVRSTLPPAPPSRSPVVPALGAPVPSPRRDPLFAAARAALPSLGAASAVPPLQEEGARPTAATASRPSWADLDASATGASLGGNERRNRSEPY